MGKKQPIIPWTMIVILLLAAILRLWQIGIVPPSPDWDEAALGYNAYSILHTGKDEYGKIFPLILRSFDDYKPALYVYLAIPSIALFGLNTFAVRLPSAILGILSVLAVYYVTKELFDVSWEVKYKKWRIDIAMLAALLLAISPWHLQFSRVAFEANAAMACNLFAVLFFIKGLKKQWLLCLSALFFAANLYMYQSEKLFVPLLVIALIFIYRKKLRTTPKKQLLTAICIGLLVCLPLLGYIISNKGVLSRATGVAITSQNTQMMMESTKRFIHEQKNNDIFGEIVDSRRVTQIKEIIGGYLSHFDLNWLFITGDQPRHHAPGIGLLYIWELPFLLIGLYTLFFLQENKKTKLLLFVWVLIAPVPAAFTFDVPHAVRTLNFLPTFQIIIALGVVTAYMFMKKYRRTFVVVLSFFAIITTLNIVYYLNQYFMQLNYFTSQDWQYGYQQAVAESTSRQSNYKQIIVSNQVPMDQSYIFFLFYTLYPPQTYQTEREREGEETNIHDFGKFQFRPINWGQEQKTHDILYIGRPQDFPEGTIPIKTINYINGQPAIEIIEG